jgi:hypothetical protein
MQLGQARPVVGVERLHLRPQPLDQQGGNSVEESDDLKVGEDEVDEFFECVRRLGKGGVRQWGTLAENIGVSIDMVNAKVPASRFGR